MTNLAPPSTTDGQPRPSLLADRGCPFTHRIRALLHQLEVPCDLDEAPLGQTPAAVVRWSPSGRIPILVHGDVVIGESRVMLEHLAEAYGFSAAYSASLAQRTRQRHAMAFVDAFLVPRLGRDDTPVDGARLAECLDVLEGAAGQPAPSLLAFHVAPMWLRFSWWQPEGALPRAVAVRAELRAWLEAVARLPAVALTAPDRAEHVAEYLRLREEKLLGKS